METTLNQPEQDRALLDDFQRELVIEMRKRLHAGDLNNNDLCKFADKCSDFQKQANDREKTTMVRERLAIARERLLAYDRRTSALYDIAHSRNETQLEIARLRAESAASKRSAKAPNHPQVDNDDTAAPYGRKEDGTAYTYDEFKESLDQAVKEIWGLPPINPKNKMPDGWNKSLNPVGDRASPDIAADDARRADHTPIRAQSESPSQSQQSSVSDDG